MKINKKILRYVFALAIAIVLFVYFVRFEGLASSRSSINADEASLITSVAHDALTNDPAHVKWVVIHDLGTRHHGGNAVFLLIDDKKHYVPSESRFCWFVNAKESLKPNVFYLNGNLEFIELDISISLHQLNEIHALLNYQEKLGLNSIEILELVTGQKIRINNEQKNHNKSNPADS